MITNYLLPRTNGNKLKFITIILVIGIVLNIEIVLCRELMSDRRSTDIYYKEHEVSEKNAKLIFKDLKNKLLNATNPAWCRKCTDEDEIYCLGKKMLHDHCCCDQRHGEDQLSWVPHTCYISHDECKPYTGSCMTYSDTRECCCHKILAQYLYPHESRSQLPKITPNFYLTMFMPIMYHHIMIYWND